MPEMKCPVCGAKLEVDEIYDGLIDNEVREEEWYGHCPKCKKQYHWTHTFKYAETSEVEEVEDEDE